jgi:Icc protein
MNRIGLQNRKALMQILNVDNKTKAVICGHIHQELAVDFNGIKVLGTPSTCFQFAPLTPEAEIDDKPPGYRVLRLHDDGNIDSNVVFLPGE